MHVIKRKKNIKSKFFTTIKKKKKRVHSATYCHLHASSQKQEPVTLTLSTAQVVRGVKNLPANARGTGWIPGLGSSLEK